VVGSSIQTAWSSWKVVPKVYGLAGHYYTMIYVPANGSFKWGTYNNDWRGYDRFSSVTDNANAGVTDNTADNHNITFKNGGWYVLHFVGEISANKKNITYALTIEPGKAYVIGAAAGGAWTDGDANWALTAPADQTGQWVSPAFTGAWRTPLLTSRFLVSTGGVQSSLSIRVPATGARLIFPPTGLPMWVQTTRYRFLPVRNSTSTSI
jgi:hypothetical protein